MEQVGLLVVASVPLAITVDMRLLQYKGLPEACHFRLLSKAPILLQVLGLEKRQLLSATCNTGTARVA